jgi:hypothetical protein
MGKMILRCGGNYVECGLGHFRVKHSTMVRQHSDRESSAIWLATIRLQSVNAAMNAGKHEHSPRIGKHFAIGFMKFPQSAFSKR